MLFIDDIYLGRSKEKLENSQEVLLIEPDSKSYYFRNDQLLLHCS